MSKRDNKNLYDEAVQRGVYADGKLVAVKCPRCHDWAGPSSSSFYRNHGRTKCEEKPDPQHLEGGLCRLCGHHVRACSCCTGAEEGSPVGTHRPALAMSSCCLAWSRAPHACIRLNTCCAHVQSCSHFAQQLTLQLNSCMRPPIRCPTLALCRPTCGCRDAGSHDAP